MRKLVTGLMFLCLLAACPAAGKAAGADALLFDLAGALRNKDLVRLRELIDAQSMVYVRSILRAPGRPAKDPLEILSGTFNLEALRRTEERLFDRLGNGMEQEECRHASRPGCPWIPEAMPNAMVNAESGDTVIAAVDNRRGIRTWLLLKQEAGSGRVWAIAESDTEARLIASREFQADLSRVRRELPALLEAKAKARADGKRADAEEYKKRAAEIEQRNREEKAAKEAVTCRLLRIAVEEREPHPQIALPAYSVLTLAMEAHNANDFAVLPITWSLTFSRPDGTQVKTITMSHYEDGDGMPLAAGERKTLTLAARRIDEKYIAGWNKGEYSAKAELLNFRKEQTPKKKVQATERALTSG